MSTFSIFKASCFLPPLPSHPRLLSLLAYLARLLRPPSLGSQDMFRRYEGAVSRCSVLSAHNECVLPSNQCHSVALLAPSWVAANLDTLRADFGGKLGEVASHGTLGQRRRDQDSVGTLSFGIRQP
jgi:hypothetical protein